MEKLLKHDLRLINLFAVLFLVTGLGSIGRGATFTVNDTGDSKDAVPNNGVCAAAAGNCTFGGERYSKD